MINLKSRRHSHLESDQVDSDSDDDDRDPEDFPAVPALQQGGGGGHWQGTEVMMMDLNADDSSSLES